MHVKGVDRPTRVIEAHIELPGAARGPAGRPRHSGVKLVRDLLELVLDPPAHRAVLPDILQRLIEAAILGVAAAGCGSREADHREGLRRGQGVILGNAIRQQSSVTAKRERAELRRANTRVGGSPKRLTGDTRIDVGALPVQGHAIVERYGFQGVADGAGGRVEERLQLEHTRPALEEFGTALQADLRLAQIVGCGGEDRPAACHD